jgi:NAD dependent epimerase/dehydratase family enzyme
VAVTTQLAEAINSCLPSQRPTVMVSASAVGYYGSSEVS